MSVEEKTTTQLAVKTDEIVELLECMIVELELHGYEKHDQIIKRATLMQEQLKGLAKG